MTQWLKKADRSATFTFCQNAPFLAAGSVAGAIDLSFSTSSQLEIFSLDLASADQDLQLAGPGVQAPERFARLAWGGTTGLDADVLPYGLLAGGLSDGSVCIWNPARIIGQSSTTGALLARLQKHQGAVRGLEFNPFSPNLLASGAADGDLCIWDVANPAQPSLYPAMKGGGSSGDITSLAWNRKVQHIVGTATAAGTVVVWDLKKQRPVISFKDPGGRRRCSAVAWNPDVATQLVVASDDDTSPALQLWDLRNSVSPLMELHGHAKGVLGVSWCPQDASFLLSSSKDNRVVVWDVPSGEPHSELPGGPNWRFDVQWAPGKSAGVFAGATFEGLVSLHTLASCQPAVTYDASGYTVPSAAASKPPAWLRCPTGSGFGFGGKLASFANSRRQLPTGEIVQTASIEVQQVVVDTDAADISPEFEQVIRNADRDALRALCEQRASGASSQEEAETWAFLQTHFEANARDHLLLRLGFSDALPKPAEEEEAQAREDQQQHQQELKEQQQPPEGFQQPMPDIAALALEQQHREHQQHIARHVLTGPAQPDDDGSGFFSHSPVDGSSFFDSLLSPNEALSPIAPQLRPQHQQEQQLAADKASVSQGDEILVDTASSTPEIVDGSPGEREDEINAAVLVGNYVVAVDMCLAANRHADALLIASLVGGEAWNRARKDFMMAHPRPFMRAVHPVLSGDWESFVRSRPVQKWRETLAALLTSAPYDEFESLVGVLAARLESAGARHAATLCHVCSGDVEAAVRAWGHDIGADASPSAKEAVMEKAVVLGLGVDRAGSSSALGDLLARQAEVLAANGKLSAAYDLLGLVPADSSEKAAELRDRLYRSGAAVAAPISYPYTEDGGLQQQQQLGSIPTAYAPSSSEFGGGSREHSVKPPAALQPLQSQTFASFAAPPLQAQQQQAPPPHTPLSNGYAAYGSGASLPPPPPPAVQTFQPQASAPPPMQYGNAPTASAPPPLPTQPAAPTVFQPQQQQQQHSAYGAPPSSFQTSAMPAAPPPISPTRNAPPQLMTSRAASTASSFAAQPPPPPPTVYQSTAPVPQQQQLPQIPSPSMAGAPPPGAFQPAPPPPPPSSMLGQAGAGPPPLQPPAVYQQTQQQHPAVTTPPAAASSAFSPAAAFPSFASTAPSTAGGAPAPPLSSVPPSSIAGSAFSPSPAHSGSLGGGLATASAPRGPPPGVTITTVDTSSVGPELRSVVASLLGLFQACEAIAGGQPSKRRELDDASRKLGALLWRMNAGEVSASVSGKLQQLCAALDAGDYGTAGHVQVQLTTSDWEECSSWLTALKRCIKLRMSG